MDPRMIPKGSGPEYNYGEQDGKARPNEPGVYFHPDAGKFVETTGVKRPDGSMAYARDAGKIQADAFKQIGYRPATEQELKEYRADQEAKAEAERKKATATTTVMSSSNERK
jgi:hypothetical protein